MGWTVLPGMTHLPFHAMYYICPLPSLFRKLMTANTCKLMRLGGKHKTRAFIYTQVSQEEWSIFWEVIVLVILSKKKKCICTCVLFRTVSEISLYSCKIVDKKEILRTVSNAGTYCSSDKFGAVYLVQYIF
jgi:hypothetical protein